MGCDCGCSETTVNCNCPSPEPIGGASLDSVLSTVFDGAPANIYNSGNGYVLTVYTNTTSTNQYIIANTNMYITSTNPHSLTTYYTLNGVSGEVNALSTGGIQRYNLAPIKTTMTHITTGKILTPGQSLSIVITSTDSTARAVWSTSFIYKYQY